jgi:chromosomal replication initiation ATPase DnaA
MGIKMKNLSQQIIKFNDNQNFRYDDFYVSKSNKHVLDFINQWPNWQKNFFNLSGERSSGKTHLMNIFIEKFKGIKLEAQLFDNKDLKKIKIYQNIIL